MDNDKRQLPGGRLVIFEGIDGIGKTTQLHLASEELAKEGWPVHVSRNLGGTPIGEALRDVMKSSVERPPLSDLYISVAIQAALTESLKSERAAGKLILLDRGPLSLAAYQSFGSGVSEDIGWRYADEGMNQLKPELVIIYQGDIATAVERARQSGQTDYFESKPINYFEGVNQGYEIAAKRYGANVIKADQPIEAVKAETLRLIRQMLAQKPSVA